MLVSASLKILLVPSTGHGLGCPAKWSLHPALGLPRHYLIEPSRKKSPLLERPDQGHEMPADVSPLVPRLLADVIGHPIQLVRGAIRRRSHAVLPCPLSSAAGIRALSGGLHLVVVSLEIRLLQAMPRPVLAEVHPRKIGILPVVLDDPESREFPCPL